MYLGARYAYSSEELLSRTLGFAVQLFSGREGMDPWGGQDGVSNNMQMVCQGYAGGMRATL